MQRVSRSLAPRLADLEERMQRLERHQVRFQEDINAQLERSDAVIEDLVAAIENLRRRLDALEQPPGGSSP